MTYWRTLTLCRQTLPWLLCHAYSVMNNVVIVVIGTDTHDYKRTVQEWIWCSHLLTTSGLVLTVISWFIRKKLTNRQLSMYLLYLMLYKIRIYQYLMCVMRCLTADPDMSRQNASVNTSPALLPPLLSCISMKMIRPTLWIVVAALMPFLHGHSGHWHYDWG